MFQCSSVPVFQCSNVPVFQCSSVPVSVLQLEADGYLRNAGLRLRSSLARFSSDGKAAASSRCATQGLTATR